MSKARSGGLVAVLLVAACAVAHATEPAGFEIKVIKARHSDMVGTTIIGTERDSRWSDEELNQMLFSDPTDIPSALSAKRYLEEVSSGALEVYGSIDPDEIDIGNDIGLKGPCLYEVDGVCYFGFEGNERSCSEPGLDPWAPTTCLIQGEAGGSPQQVLLNKIDCDVARALDIYQGCAPGEGCNWLGDEPEDLFILLFPFPVPHNMCGWPAGIGGGAVWAAEQGPTTLELFGKRVVFLTDSSASVDTNPLFPGYTADNWMQVQVGMAVHEIGHIFGFNHENGEHFQLRNANGVYTPVIYSNLAWVDAPWSRWWDSHFVDGLWVTTWLAEDGMEWFPINNRTSIMSSSGMWNNTFWMLQDQYHGAHYSMWQKLHKDDGTDSVWVDEDTIAYLDPNDKKSKSKWTLKLSPSEQSQGDPNLNHHAAAILQVNEFETFLLEFRRPASENTWDFDLFEVDDPLVNGLLIYSAFSHPWGSETLHQARLLDCNPEPFDPYRSHDDAACGVGQVAMFYVREADGTDTRVRIEVMDINTLPGDQWLKVRVTVKKNACEIDDESWDEIDEEDTTEGCSE